MLKSVASALILITLSVTPALSDYFIQITGNPPDKAYVDEGDPPGGIEIYKGDEFVACVLGFTVSSWNGDLLAPVSFGFISKYPLKDLIIKPRGAMVRMKLITKEVKT